VGDEASTVTEFTCPIRELRCAPSVARRSRMLLSEVATVICSPSGDQQAAFTSPMSTTEAVLN
jgi:hypothetical protein